MKTESEIRAMLDALMAFDVPTETGSIHGPAVRALMWVLGEYPPKPVEHSREVNPGEPASALPKFNIAHPMGQGGFAVRNFPNMREKTEGE